MIKIILAIFLIGCFMNGFAQDIKSITIKNTSAVVVYDSIVNGIEIHSDTIIKKSCVRRLWFTTCKNDTSVNTTTNSYIDTLHLVRTLNKPVEMKYIFALATLLPVLQIQGQVYRLTKYGFSLAYDSIPIPPASATEYGVFKLTPGTFSQRINDVKESGATLFRLSYLNGAGYAIQQVADSGLNVELTFNYNQIGVNNGYATDSNSFKHDLLQTLASATAKPKYITVRNEFANPNYWDTSHIERYVNNELNPAVHIGDSMGIPVGDGGFLPNLVFTLLKYYQDNNLTDSINWLCDSTGISPSSTSSPSVIKTMRLYAYVLDSSNINAIYNQHWVEPFGLMDTTHTTTSSVLPVLINYVKSRTGKRNMTSEFHTENNSQDLLFALCDEFNSTEPVTEEYFSGDTALGSVDLLSYYALWIASLSALP